MPGKSFFLSEWERDKWENNQSSFSSFLVLLWVINIFLCPRNKLCTLLIMASSREVEKQRFCFRIPVVPLSPNSLEGCNATSPSRQSAPASRERLEVRQNQVGAGRNYKGYGPRRLISSPSTRPAGQAGGQVHTVSCVFAKVKLLGIFSLLLIFYWFLNKQHMHSGAQFKDSRRLRRERWGFLDPGP